MVSGRASGMRCPPDENFVGPSEADYTFKYHFNQRRQAFIDALVEEYLAKVQSRFNKKPKDIQRMKPAI